MSAKKWLIAFFGCVLFVLLLIAGLNFFVDPFGVFGDRFMQWYSFDFTNNPRAAKTAYLDINSEQYDSYLIGCSSTSSFPIDSLNEYTGANFFNLFSYGADTYDMYATAMYVLDNYNPKNILLNLSIMNTYYYDYESDPLTDSLHAKVDGSSLLSFYLRFLFANPQYAFAKLSDLREDTYLPQTFDVFNEESGAYDKSVRDVESIGNMDEYLSAYPVFTDYPKAGYALKEADRCLEAVREIVERCERDGVTLTVVFSPLYYEHAEYFDADATRDFLARLADITGFWDFSYSSVSFDSRYFYDATHFRNSVGEMALSRIYGGEFYVPDDFGFYVTAENAEEYLSGYRTAETPDTGEYTAEVPILTYHHIAEGASSTVTSPEAFESHLSALIDAGYTPVFLSELRNYVLYGDPLPEKPVVITFDDGYLSNYEQALPILEKYGAKATIFVIGVSFGSDTYKDTGNAITPHFGLDEAQAMLSSGLIEFGSHTYDLHQWPPFEEGDARENLALRDGESESDYISMLRNDLEQFDSEIWSVLGGNSGIFSYPYGEVTTEAAVVLSESGYDVTVSTQPGVNTIVRGLPQSLLSLNRFTVDGSMTDADILSLIEGN